MTAATGIDLATPAAGRAPLRILLAGADRALHALLERLQAAPWSPPAPGMLGQPEPGIDYWRWRAKDGERQLARLPAWEHFSSEMLAAASGADLLVLLVDARHGWREQAGPWLLLAGTTDLQPVLLVLTGPVEPADVEALRCELAPLSRAHGFALPEVLALRSQGSAGTDWQRLVQRLQQLEAPAPGERPALLAVQQRGPERNQCSVRLVCGRLQAGAQLRAASSGELLRVRALRSLGGTALADAAEGERIRLELEGEPAVTVGELLAPSDRPLALSDQFEARLVWLRDQPGLVGRRYQIRLAGQWAAASLTAIKQQVDPRALAAKPGRALARDQVAVCTLALNRPLAFDSHARSRELGTLLLLDPQSGEALAVGMIRHSLRRAQNVHLQRLSVDRARREALNGHPGKVIWFTGLSGSGKSSIANALEQHLHAQGRRTYILDGDNLRHGLNKDLGFTEADRVENIRRVAEVARLMMDAGLIVMTAFISPFRREREMARELIGAEHFIEVYVSTPLEVCEARDVKGLYRKARSGQLPNMTGIDSPYEPPEQAELEIDASQGSPALLAERIGRRLALAC